MKKVFIGIAQVLDSNWFAVLFVASIFGSMLWAGGVFAGIFQNTTERLDEAQMVYSEWESFSARHGRSLQRNLFNAHCDAIDKKKKDREVIDNVRYVLPCDKSDINHYFRVRNEIIEETGDFPQANQ